MRDCHPNIQLNIAGYSFLCTVCETYYPPPDEDQDMLVWLCDTKVNFHMCLECCRENKLQKKLSRAPPQKGDAALPRYVQWRAFSLRQERLYEKDQPVTSITDATALDTSTEAYRELEIKIHTNGEMPRPLLYEVEIALAKQERMMDFDPLIRQLLIESKWPLHTAMRVLKLAKDAKEAYPETAAIWQNQIEHLEAVTVDMIEDFDEQAYIRQLLINPRPSNKTPPKPLLTLALEADHTKFLAHRVVQSVIQQKWESPMRLDEGSTPANFLISRVLLWITMHLIHFANWVSRGRLERSVVTIHDKQKHPIIDQFTHDLDKSAKHTLDFFSVSPKSAFYLNFSLYLVFVGVVSWGASRTALPKFDVADIVITIFIVGFVLQELKQLGKRRWDYFDSMWNYFDIAHLSTYIVVLVIKAVAAGIPSSSHQTNLLEAYDCFYAVAVFMTFTRGLYVMLPFQKVGPMLVSFGSMLRSVVTFLFLAIIVILAFAFSLQHLFNNANMPYRTDEELSQPVTETELTPHLRGLLLLRIFITLIYGINNVPDLPPEKLTSGRFVIATLFMLGYMVVLTIVLINLLIAIVSRSHSEVMDQADNGHKAHFAGVVDEFTKTPPLPPPLNILTELVVPTVGVVARLMREGTLCSCCYCNCLSKNCFHDESPWNSPQPGLFCMNVAKHTQYFLNSKRLYKAVFAEAAVRFKLAQWLRVTLTKPDKDDDTLQEEIDEMTGRLAKLTRAANEYLGSASGSLIPTIITEEGAAASSAIAVTAASPK
jgi:large-conductance mechanosensitive channel